MLRVLNENEMEMVSGGTASSGWGPDGDRGFFEQVGNILDNPNTETGIVVDQIIEVAVNTLDSLPSSTDLLISAGRGIAGIKDSGLTARGLVGAAIIRFRDP